MLGSVREKRNVVALQQKPSQLGSHGAAATSPPASIPAATPAAGLSTGPTIPMLWHTLLSRLSLRASFQRMLSLCQNSSWSCLQGNTSIFSRLGVPFSFFLFIFFKQISVNGCFNL